MSFWVLPKYFYGAFVCWIWNDPFTVIFLLGQCWVYFGFFSFQGSTNNIERKVCSFWFIFLILESVTVKGALNSKIVFLGLIKQENFDLCSQSRCWGSIQKDRRSGSTDRYVERCKPKRSTQTCFAFSCSPTLNLNLFQVLVHVKWECIVLLLFNYNGETTNYSVFYLVCILCWLHLHC